MTKHTGPGTSQALEDLWRVVADHGDAFRFSISKRGRIWMTLTHWDQEKYNTSVELDGMGDGGDILPALGLLVYAHCAKCFGSVAHQDTWTNVQETRDLASDPLVVAGPRFAVSTGGATFPANTGTVSDQGRDKEVDK